MGENLCKHVRSEMPSSGVEDEHAVEMHILGCKVRDSSLMSLPLQQSLTVAGKNCTVEIHKKPRTEILQFPLRPSSFLTDFEDLSKIIIPFATNIRGIVHTITGTGTTHNG